VIKVLGRKTILILVAVILLISLSGCAGLKTAQLEISFDPNPVPCIDGKRHWDVIMSEINGVGVSLKTIVQDVYVGDQKVNSYFYDENWMQENLGSSYLPAFSSMINGAGCGCYVTHQIFTVTGIDDNGHEIEATGKVEALD
jgi:hypothetical protein